MQPRRREDCIPPWLSFLISVPPGPTGFSFGYQEETKKNSERRCEHPRSLWLLPTSSTSLVSLSSPSPITQSLLQLPEHASILPTSELGLGLSANSSHRQMPSLQTLSELSSHHFVREAFCGWYFLSIGPQAPGQGAYLCYQTFMDHKDLDSHLEHNKYSMQICR